MSLFGAIQQSASGLQASQVGLQVVGNNIANANTPGYIRQRMETVPSIATRAGGLLLGHGVRVTGVTQMIDKALAERMFAASTAAAGGETLDRAYNRLEQLVGSIDGGGLSGKLSTFNNALSDLTTQPADRSLRDFVVMQGDSLAKSIRSVQSQAIDAQNEFDADLGGVAENINSQLQRIARLNVQISTIEGGRTLGSDATGLREQRYTAIEELSKYVDVNLQEQSTGSISVFNGGDYLVAEGIAREVVATYSPDVDGLQVRIKQTDAPLSGAGGILGAAVTARSEIFGGFLKDLDKLASGLIMAMNEIHSQGQGRIGFTDVLGTNVGKTGIPLKDAGLPVMPTNGTFQISVLDDTGAVTSKTNIAVRALNQLGDSTFDSVARDINAIDGLTASITSDGRLQIIADPQVSFTFGEDTSSFLSAAGINTFFTGSGASDIAVNKTVRDNSDLLAISKSGIGQDTDVLTQLVGLIDRPTPLLDGNSVRNILDANTASLAQQINLQKSLTAGANDLYSTLQTQHLGITGVNIDEESLKLITYNRAFQASARVISTASEMLDLLTKL